MKQSGESKDCGQLGSALGHQIHLEPRMMADLEKKGG